MPSLLWCDLKEEVVKELSEMMDRPESQHKLLASLLSLEFYDEDERERIVLDFLFNNLRFALSAGFTDKQVSTFFSIMKRVLYDARGLLADRGVWPSLPQSFDTFKGLVLAHAGVQSGEEVIFDKDAVSKLTEYVTETFYRHFSLYKAVFTREQDVIPITKAVVVETPLIPPPLADATQQ